jgi:two-component sensor histidine kinase/tetratricopeptide (TPR) repeat protein
MNFGKLLLIVLLLLHQVALASNADTILKAIDDADDPLEKARNFISLGDVYEYTEPAKAIGYYKNAFELARSVSMSSRNRTLSPEADILMAKCLRYMGIVYSDGGEFENALDHYFETKSLLEDLKGTFTSPFRNEILTEYAKLLNNIGQLYSRQGVFSIAKEYNLQALESYYELQDTTSIAVASSSMGIVHARMGELAEALQYFQLALDYYTLKSHEEGMAQSFNNIAGIHYQTSSWDEALELYIKSHDIYVSRNHLHRVAATKMNIGLIFKHKGEFEKSMEHLQNSLQIRQEISDRAGIVESLNNIGELLTIRKDHTEARKYYHQAYEIASQIGDNRIISNSLINLGKEFYLLGNTYQAIAHTLRGLEVSREFGIKFSEQAAIKQLSDYYAAAGDYKKALEYAHAHYNISQEILDEQKVKQINQLTIEFKAREKQQRIDFLEKEGEVNQIRLRQSRTMILVLALLFLIALVLTVFSLVLFRQRNKIIMLQKESEASRLIKKTNNDLQAILKTHTHGMILFDDELNIMGHNSKALYWMQKFAGAVPGEPVTFSQSNNPLIQAIISETVNQSMKGYSCEVEKEFDTDDQTFYYKFFSNPVFESDDHLIQSVCLMIEDVTERRMSEKQILADLREKETLIKEIHHRVKNNMQVIISLIRMQSMKFQDPKQINSFHELEQRISAMAYVHEDLYKSENLSDIRFDDYIQRISANLVSAYGGNIHIKSDVEMQNPYMDIDLAMPCGLVINELITNSLKHAFNGVHSNGSEKKISVEFIEYPLNYEMIIVDNGVGLSKEFNLKQSSQMGLHLVKIIVEEQLRGTWSMHGTSGLKVTVSFPKRKA